MSIVSHPVDNQFDIIFYYQTLPIHTIPQTTPTPHPAPTVASMGPIDRIFPTLSPRVGFCKSPIKKHSFLCVKYLATIGRSAIGRVERPFPVVRIFGIELFR